MRVLLLLAHPEPASFCAALYRTVVTVLGDAGHQLCLSDLHAMGFDPVPGRHDFRQRGNPGCFKYQTEQAHAAAHDGFAPVLSGEMAKLAWCDVALFCCPLCVWSPARLEAAGREGALAAWRDRLGGIETEPALAGRTLAAYPDPMHDHPTQYRI